MKRFAGAVYAGSGLVLTFLCWQAMMMAVWGAKIHWLTYVGLASAITLTVGGFMLLSTGGEKGQMACMAGIAGLAVMMLPAAVALVPAEGLRINPIAYVIFAAFVGLAAAVMFYPERMPWARSLVIGLVLGFVAVIGVTAWSRWRAGEFDRPVIIGFVAERSAEPVKLPPNAGPGVRPDLLSAALLAEIGKLGVGGRLRWTGMVGANSRDATMVVIATGPIAAEQRLRYPRRGLIVHVWNGERWSTVPADADLHSSYITLRTDGMLSRFVAGGGDQMFGFMPWKAPPVTGR